MRITKAVRVASVAAGAVALTIALTAAGPGSPSAPAAPAPQAAPPACTAGTQVQTVEGPVCGLTAGGVTSYLGVRYAASTAGANRWRPPQPVTPWTDTFAATAAGNQCPQPGFGGPPRTTEDCLNLNVQIPADAKPGERLPVMVEIHGGGFSFFGPPSGAHLVSAGHVVYVAMNYRLGIMGFLAAAALGEHSGDYGLQDQQAALRWVQRNIARFGGDPRNVTIFGQSAGGASVCEQAISPAAKGLFHKGISQSGFYNSSIGPNQVWEAADCKAHLPTQHEADAAGAAFAAKVGCGTVADVAACLRAVPTTTLVTNSGGLVYGQTAGGTIAPTVNGTTLPMSPGEAFEKGQVNDVSLSIGVDRDEINGGANDDTNTARTPAQYRSLVQFKYGALASTVLRLYPLARFPDSSPFIALRTVVADADSVCPALLADQRLARHIPVYAWENDDADSPPSFLSTADPNGAYHDAEDVFLIPSSPPTLDANQQALADQITAQWTGYARTGNPTVAGTPLWTRFTRGNPSVMSLVGAGDSVMTPLSTLEAQHNCGFWNAVSPQPS